MPVYLTHGVSYQTHASGNQQGNRTLEQRSASLDQSEPQAEIQRELVGGIYPSDFGAFVLHPETIQTSAIQNKPEDMSVYYQQKQPLSSEVKAPAQVHESHVSHPIADEEKRVPPPNYTATAEPIHDKDILFFGDSNTTEPRAQSRSTLDQDGLRRGSISTLPYASEKRRSSAAESRRESLKQAAEENSHIHTGTRPESRSLLDQDGLRRGSISTLPSASDHKRKSSLKPATEQKVEQHTNNEPRATSRTMLDQEGLHRGNITTLPSASDHHPKNAPIDEQLKSDSGVRVIKNQITPLHERTTDTNVNRKPSLTERAYAAAAGVAAGVAGAATSLFATNKDDYDMHGPHYVVRDEYGPYKDATTCNYEPAIHGQEPCFKTNEECNPEVKPDDKHPFCSHVNEPVICFERPHYTSKDGIPQSQLHQHTKRTDLDNCNVLEGQVASSGSNTIVHWNTESNPPAIQSSGIPESQLHQPTKRTSLDDSNVLDGQIASRGSQDQQGLLSKASGLAAAASATLFGTKKPTETQKTLENLDKPKENVETNQVDKDASRTSIFKNFKGIPLNDEEEQQGGFLNKVSAGATAAATGVAAVASGAAATLFGSKEKKDDKTDLPPTAAVAATTAAILHQNSQHFKNNAPTAAVAATSAANLKNANEHLDSTTHKGDNTIHDSGIAPTAAVAATSAANLKKANEHLDSTTHKGDSTTRDLGIAPTAAVDTTSAANLQNKDNTNLGIAPTAAIVPTAAIAATNLKDKEHTSTDSTNNTNNLPSSIAAQTNAENIVSVQKDASIPSDKSINSARAIKHGNFDHITDSTDPSFVDKHYNSKQKSGGIKTKAASAFRRLSRDSSHGSGSIDKSSIVKQNDGHRLSDAEQFKQHHTQYARVPGVTGGPVEGEHQFVRTDEDIPSRGTYVSGKIEKRRGSIQVKHILKLSYRVLTPPLESVWNPFE